MVSVMLCAMILPANHVISTLANVSLVTIIKLQSMGNVLNKAVQYKIVRFVEIQVAIYAMMDISY